LAGEAKDDQKLGRKEKKRKEKAKEETSADKSILKDSRFDAVFESPDFAIDPTHKKYTPTPTNKMLQNERLKRRSESVTQPQGTTQSSLSPSLSSLVESVKKKAQNYPTMKKQKIV